MRQFKNERLCASSPETRNRVSVREFGSWEKRGAKARWMMLAFALLLAFPPFSAEAASAARELPVPAQASISAVLGRDDHAYHAVPRGQGVQLSNPRHRLAGALTQEGGEIKRGSDQWSFVWQGVGYGAPSHPGPAVEPLADLNQGSAYVLARPASGWAGTLTQTAKLTASDGGKDAPYAPHSPFGSFVRFTSPA